MTRDEMLTLSQEDRETVWAWLADHGIRYCYEWDVVDGALVASVYKVDDQGNRYVCRDLDCSCPNRLHAAAETVDVPLGSPQPVVGA